MIKNDTKQSDSGRGGFTLVEVIVALAIITIGILAVNAMQTAATRGNYTAANITTASTWAADQIEQILTLDYDEWIDTNGNGFGIADGAAELALSQDKNQNGIDDDDELLPAVDDIANYGLDQDTVALADGSTTSNDAQQKYTILWNVADNVPMPDTKTIQVIVTWQEGGLTKSVTLKHKKTRL